MPLGPVDILRQWLALQLFAVFQGRSSGTLLLLSPSRRYKLFLLISLSNDRGAMHACLEAVRVQNRVRRDVSFLVVSGVLIDIGFGF